MGNQTRFSTCDLGGGRCPAAIEDQQEKHEAAAQRWAQIYVMRFQRDADVADSAGPV
jgi:hypothetical protein